MRSTFFAHQQGGNSEVPKVDAYAYGYLGPDWLYESYAVLNTFALSALKRFAAPLLVFDLTLAMFMYPHTHVNR